MTTPALLPWRRCDGWTPLLKREFEHAKTAQLWTFCAVSEHPILTVNNCQQGPKMNSNKYPIRNSSFMQKTYFKQSYAVHTNESHALPWPMTVVFLVCQDRLFLRIPEFSGLLEKCFNKTSLCKHVCSVPPTQVSNTKKGLLFPFPSHWRAPQRLERDRDPDQELPDRSALCGIINIEGAVSATSKTQLYSNLAQFAGLLQF